MADGRDDGEGTGDSTTSEALDRLSEGVFGLDTDWRFTYLSETGRAVICDAAGESLTVAELVGRNIWEVVGTTFEQQYREAMRTGNGYPSTRTTNRSTRGWRCGPPRPRRGWPSVSATSPNGVGATTRETVLREIYEAIVDRESTVEERVADLLRIGQRVLGTDYGTLSRVQGDEYVFEVVPRPAT